MHSSSTVGIPHSFIILTGLFPVPPPAPSNVTKSTSHLEAIFNILSKSSGSNGPVLKQILFAPFALSSAILFSKWSSSQTGNLPILSKTWPIPDL